MKKNIAIVIVILMAINMQGQQSKIIKQRSSADYLEKSKRQKNTGFILLGGRVATFTGGLIAMQYSASKGRREATFLLGGMAMVTASIPFFIASLSSKHKAKIYMNREALRSTPNLKTGIVNNSAAGIINFSMS